MHGVGQSQANHRTTFSVGGACADCWSSVLDLALTFWVARAATLLVVLGFLILGAAPQAQDLLLPLVDSSAAGVLLFFVAIFIFWAMPTHYSARLALDDDERLNAHAQRRKSRFLDAAIIWVPRLLGASTFLALLVCANRARINLPILPYDEGVTRSLITSLGWFMGWCVVAIGVFIAYTMGRGAIAQLGLLARAEALVARRLSWLIRLLDIGRKRSRGYSDPQAAATSSLGRVALIGYFLLFLVVLFTEPSRVAHYLPRAWAIGLALGSWLPVLTFLSVVGRRLRAPLILATFLGVAVLIVVMGLKYEIRLAPAHAANDRIPLDRAIADWKSANGCSGDDCPRPIVIMAAGGASRAGFFTASIIGELLDRGGENGLDAAKVRNRIFAISGVSGGSVGAVMSVAAMASGKGADRAQQPCQPTGIPLWYGGQVENWRGCLEALTTGDFLTPTFIGLFFHDIAAFGPRSSSQSNRGLFIEQAWERRMREVMGDAERTAPCPTDLECPFLSLRPTDKQWLPLLILNGTSVGTGQRIVTTLLQPTYAPRELCPTPSRDGECYLFNETFHFHDMIGHGRAVSAPLPDIRLSTAALNSARFPIISPPGEIVAANGTSIDRIVDGGYLENYGALSTIELVTAIRAVDPRLKPFVLAISNDPGLALNPQAYPDNVSDTDFVTDAASVLEALLRTRDARGSVSLNHLQTLVTRDGDGCKSSFAHVRVWPIRPKNDTCFKEENVKAPALSMSWWLSTPVQLRLVAEIDRRSCNADALTDIWAAMKSNATCSRDWRAP